jgi:hypothetical protein
MNTYIKKTQQKLIPWTEDMPMDLISVSEADKNNGSPKTGDMIAFNPKDKTDMWLVSEQFFKDNYIPAIEATKTDNSEVIADLIKERDELKAHCEKLRNCLMKASAMDPDRIGFEKCLGKTLASTPQQSLAEIKVQTIEEYVHQIYAPYEYTASYGEFVQETLEYAEELREQAK